MSDNMSDNMLDNIDNETSKLIKLVQDSLEDDPRTIKLKAKDIHEIPVELINLISKDNYKVESLEILDISRNRIKKLPNDFGKLVSLKLLKISKNLIKIIPNYIADMKDLQYLKIDNNPIRFPPRSIHIMPKGDEKEVMVLWLSKLKEYLRQHSASRNHEIEESDNSSDGEEEVDQDETADHKLLKKSASVDSINNLDVNLDSRLTIENSNLLNTITEDEQMIPKLEKKRSSPKLSLDLPSRRDRSFSNDSDITLMNFRNNFVRSHSKSFSHNSPTISHTILEERNSEFYFQRLKTLPPTEHLRMSDISLREASRNILYALSQIHKALRQFVIFTGNEKIFTVELNKTNHSIGQLCAALQKFDTFALQSTGDAEHWVKLLGACQENVTNFKILLDLLNKHLKYLTQPPENFRYSRTLLLMFHGATVDIKFAWENISPLLHNSTPYTGNLTPIRSKSMSRSNSSSNLNGIPNSAGSVINSSPQSVSSPSTAGMSPSSYHGPYSAGIINNSHTDIALPISIFDQMLLKVDAAIKAVESVGKNLIEQLDTALGLSADESTPTLPVKLKELRSHVKSVLDVTKQLKKSRLSVKLSQKDDLSIQLKETVKMFELAKNISQEWQLFSREVMTGLGHVTKSNIELTDILRAIEEWLVMPLQPSPSPPPNETPKPVKDNEIPSFSDNNDIKYTEEPEEFISSNLDESIQRKENEISSIGNNGVKTDVTYLRTVDNIEYPTFKMAAIQLGLMENNQEWDLCPREAS
ncbi:24564_t:CDS:2 [Dentiscutata erythropus]|uniref:24564_t:CDS:1 n=1 Tax=Dentiscutata erythropus TaxID=1348616 RepID=A0A9N8YV83_9GLOM|nr:24564_t:CDS:2 [Dentiscutata erythropus]